MIPRVLFVFVLAASCLLACSESGQQAEAEIKEGNMTRDVYRVLESSKDPMELASAARELARSSQVNDHEVLLGFLRSEDFLKRLDSEEDYQGPSLRLRVGRVLMALRENNAEIAHTTLVRLTQEREFTKNWSRADLLILAVAVVRSAPPEVIKFWDQHCQPEDGFMSLTIGAIVENGSRPAMALLEKKMADDRFDEEERIGWMRVVILLHRHDLPLLESCERMLASGLPEKLRPPLVEALFDYRPDEWYGADPDIEPPPLEKATPEARRQLRRIGELASRTMLLSVRQKKAIEKTLEEIDNNR